jgi:hypothetical protein
MLGLLLALDMLSIKLVKKKALIFSDI